MGWWQALQGGWERLMTWLGWRRPLLPDARLDLGALRKAVAEVEAAAAQRSVQPPIIRLHMHAVLRLLGEAGERLDTLVGTPSGGLREDGLELAALARLAAAAVATRGMRREEEKALGLAAHAVLRVAAREHHLVGPAMLAWADATAGVGNREQALGCYRAVVSDFRALLDLPERDEGDLAALGCLATALQRLQESGEGEPELAERVRGVLDREV